jgi:FMN phosphatase YigB (HAD superfamily)/DNA-binding XRE family transcriptional regulator
MDEQSLGRHLQSARTAAGLTQQELCQRANISYSTLAKIERGAIKSPSVFTIQRLADVLGTTLDQLMGSMPSLPKAKTARSQSGVTFVYFDINGCLVRFFHRAFTELAQTSGVSADRIETTFWHYNDAVCRGEMSLDDFNRIMADTCKMMVDWKRFYMSAVDPIIEMHELVSWAASNYRVGLLSNIMPGFIAEMMQSGLIPSLSFDAIIDSSEVGAIKPEKKIYEIAQERAGVLSSEILLIDDSRANIMAAEHMGWKVMWFDDYRPDESVARLRQALEMIEDSEETSVPETAPIAQSLNQTESSYAPEIPERSHSETATQPAPQENSPQPISYL